MNRITLLIVLLLLTATSANAQRLRGYDDDYTKFRIALQGGYSQRLAKISTNVPLEFRSYVSELKKGYHFGGNAAFFFNERYGAGIQYSSMQAKNQLTGITAQDPSTKLLLQGNMSDYIVINFIGPTFNTRQILGANDNVHLLASVGLGYITYTDDAAVITPFMLKGNTLGASMNIGFDIALHENIFIGIETSLLTGVISSFEYSDATRTETIELPDNAKENLLRVDASGGIRFNF
jgi:hypothetical protein